MPYDAENFAILEKSISNAIRILESTLKGLKINQHALPIKDVVGECVLCDRPILTGEKTTRGRHTACYNSLYVQRVKTGIDTLDQLEAEGLIDPVAKPGRKSKAADHSKKIAAAKTRITKGKPPGKRDE